MSCLSLAAYLASILSRLYLVLPFVNVQEVVLGPKRRSSAGKGVAKANDLSLTPWDHLTEITNPHSCPLTYWHMGLSHPVFTTTHFEMFFKICL